MRINLKWLNPTVKNIEYPIYASTPTIEIDLLGQRIFLLAGIFTRDKNNNVIPVKLDVLDFLRKNPYILQCLITSTDLRIENEQL